MKNHLKHSCLIGCTVCVFLARQPFALAQSSTNFTLEKDVMDEGGSVSSSENYQVTDAIGQPCPIGISASTEYGESSGFFAGGGAATDVAQETAQSVPEEFALLQNYPNPFNPETAIQFTLPEQGRVTLKIFDIMGREVKTLLDEERSAGPYTALWDGKDEFGRSVASGMYFYQLRFKDKVLTKKFTLMR